MSRLSAAITSSANGWTPSSTVSPSVSNHQSPFIILSVAIESAALVEKLLNDLLKTTEGFQRLKKMNEDLKGQVNTDTLYVRIWWR